MSFEEARCSKVCRLRLETVVQHSKLCSTTLAKKLQSKFPSDIHQISCINIDHWTYLCPILNHFVIITRRDLDFWCETNWVCTVPLLVMQFDASNPATQLELLRKQMQFMGYIDQYQLLDVCFLSILSVVIGSAVDLSD